MLWLHWMVHLQLNFCNGYSGHEPNANVGGSVCVCVCVRVRQIQWLSIGVHCLCLHTLCFRLLSLSFSLSPIRFDTMRWNVLVLNIDVVIAAAAVATTDRVFCFVRMYCCDLNAFLTFIFQINRKVPLMRRLLCMWTIKILLSFSLCCLCFFFFRLHTRLSTHSSVLHATVLFICYCFFFFSRLLLLDFIRCIFKTFRNLFWSFCTICHAVNVIGF